MTTIDDGGPFSNVASADARVRLNDQTVLTAQFAGSFARMPFRDAVLGGTRERYGNGLAYYARIETARPAHAGGRDSVRLEP